MDYNHYPNNMELDGPAEVNYGAGTMQHHYPMSFVSVPQDALPEHAGSYETGPFAAEYQIDLNNSHAVDMSDPSAHGAFSLGPSTQEHPVYVPGHLNSLYDAYVTSYNDEATPNSIRMEHARALALALLTHYYPEAEGYVVQPSNLSSIARHGMNFMLKASNGSDPNYTPLPPRKDQKKGKKKATKAQRNAQRRAEYTRQVNHWWPFTTSVKWHMVEPEDIACFEVLKKSTITHDDGADETNLFLHTCLAIMIDNPEILPQLAETNDVNRGDILTDVFSRSGQTRRGYGILLFGTRLEVYEFDNGEETRIVDGDSKKHVEGMVSVEEPTVTLCQTANDESADGGYGVQNGCVKGCGILGQGH